MGSAQTADDGDAEGTEEGCGAGCAVGIGVAVVAMVGVVAMAFVVRGSRPAPKTVTVTKNSDELPEVDADVADVAPTPATGEPPGQFV